MEKIPEFGIFSYKPFRWCYFQIGLWKMCDFTYFHSHKSKENMWIKMNKWLYKSCTSVNPENPYRTELFVEIYGIIASHFRTSPPPPHVVSPPPSRPRKFRWSLLPGDFLGEILRSRIYIVGPLLASVALRRSLRPSSLRDFKLQTPSLRPWKTST